jgi:ankyrin repeat protein
MNIEDLHELLVEAPTGGAEASALAVVTSLARDGDLAASLTQLRALARAVGCDAALPLLAQVTSMDGLLAADLPAPLGAYAAALHPRTFLANVKRLATRTSSNDDGALSGLRRLVVSRDVLQHEALKAHVLTALAGLINMHERIGTLTPSHLMPILDHVLANARIVEGRESDDSLHFGRERLLDLHSTGTLYFIITHELGHNVFDRFLGKGSGTGAAGHDAALSELAAALPQLMDSACELRGRQFEVNDARAFLAFTGVRLLCTHERRPGGPYFHMSLMQSGGPVDLHVGATYARFVLALVGIEPSRAAAAWSARGALHFGFRGDQQDVLRAIPPNEVIAARIQKALTEGPAWIDALRADGRLGESERDVPIALGVEPRRPCAYGKDCERTFNDLNLVAQADAVSSLGALTEPQAIAVLAAAWRCAAPAVLRRLLHEQVGLLEKLSTADWPLGEIGASLCALRDEHGVVTYYGPTVSDIGAVLHALRDLGVPLDGPADTDGRTLLVRAVFKGPSLVRLALDCGADPDRASANGDTPLLACATAGSVAVAEALAAAGASLQSRDPEGRTALHRAAGQNHEELLVWLLAHGAEVDARDSNGETALMRAPTRSAVMALCDAGAAVQAATGEGVTALHFAARYGRSEVVHGLLSRGADPDAATGMGETPLHYAVLANAGTDCMAALLDAGADIDEETDEGVTALMVAARTAHLDMVEWLLDHGAGVDARTVTGDTALIMASDGRNEWARDFSFNSRLEQCLRRLVQAGADINAANDMGVTAVYAATWGFDAGRVSCLLELGADPNIADRDGRTPLSVAQAKGHAAMVEALTSAARTKGNA